MPFLRVEIQALFTDLKHINNHVPAQLSFQSTHVFGVGEAIELARVLEQLPPILIVYAIEGENFSTGIGLTSKVERSSTKGC